MNGWWYGAVHLIGALISTRIFILYQQTRVEKEGRWRKWTRHPESPLVVFVPLFWPVLAAAWLCWKLMFPRGIRTKYSIRREREEKQRERERALQRLDEAAARLLELEMKAPPLAICAGEDGGGPSLEQRKYAMAYTAAEHEFAEACRVVEENRGKPWSIGHLTNVRIRKPRVRVS